MQPERRSAGAPEASPLTHPISQMKVPQRVIARQLRAEAAELRRHGFLEDPLALFLAHLAEREAKRRASEALASFRQAWQAIPARR